MNNSNFGSSWKQNSKSQTSSGRQPDQQADPLDQKISTGSVVLPEDLEKQDNNLKIDRKISLSKKTKLSQFFNKHGKKLAVVGGVLLLLLLIVGGVGFYAYTKARALEKDLRQAMGDGKLAYVSFKTQNLPQTKENLNQVKLHLESGQQKMRGLAFAGYVPLVRRYYFDAQAGLEAGVDGVEAGLLVIEAIEPHADVLGFSGEGSFAGGTTQDRIALMLETLGQITPQLDAIGEKVMAMDQSIQTINPQDYPENAFGYPVRGYVQQLHGVVEGAKLAFTDARPVLEQLPAMAGADGERKKYLVIFQNDNELRPTGGFMTAYAVVNVENGQVTPEKSDDIYELDQRFYNKPEIPEELGKYLITESRWNIRDMNIDPNFKQSMETLFSYYNEIRGEPDNVDGIIAVDTNLLAGIIEILGPVEVPGYGTFSAEIDPRCDCPQIIYALSEIIDRPTPYHREDRKGILAPMMQSIIAKTYATSRDKWPKLAELTWSSVQSRNLQFYFLDEQMQAAAEAINAAGIIPDLPDQGDYLTVIDANLGGAKSNLFVDVAGQQLITKIENGSLTKEVELTYRNTHPASNCDLEAGLLCLNANLNNWTRWYLPKGVKIDQVQGLREGYQVQTDHPDYDVLSGFFQLAPMGQSKIKVTYQVPYYLENQYVLKMQKQGGTDPIPFEIRTPFGEQEFVLAKDISVEIKP